MKQTPNPFSEWTYLMANMDNRGRFFKPFKRLGAGFSAKVQLFRGCCAASTRY
jgi:hypothetical protein